MNKLIFVYNADSTFFAVVNDIVRKIVAPERQECSLCKITYDALSPKKEWVAFLATLTEEKVFLHRDEFRSLYPDKKDAALPAIFLQRNETLSVVATTEEIGRAKTVAELAVMLGEKLR